MLAMRQTVCRVHAAAAHTPQQFTITLRQPSALRPLPAPLALQLPRKPKTDDRAFT